MQPTNSRELYMEWNQRKNINFAQNHSPILKASTPHIAIIWSWMAQKKREESATRA